MQDQYRKRLGELRNQLELNPNDQSAVASITKVLFEMGMDGLGREFLINYASNHLMEPVIEEVGRELGIPLPKQADPLQNEYYLAQLAALPAVTANWTRPPSQFSDIAILLDTIHGWILKDQERFLFEKVKSLPDGAVVLEMGACRGKSTAAMAFACVGSRKRIYSVDTFCGNEGLMGKVEEFQPVWAGNLRRFGLEQYAIPLRGFTTEMVPQFHLYPPPDFVFIDAAHEYLDVLADFRNVYPYVKEGGWISFHDVEMGWPGSWRVWKDYALGILSDPEYSTTLACGRKTAGRPFKRGSDRKAGFDFGEEVCREFAAKPGTDPALVSALRTSLAGDAGTAEGRERIRAAELRIRNATEQYFHATMRDMINAKDGRIDGAIRLWHGLSLAGQDRFAEALEQFESALLASRPMPPERLEAYLAEARSRADKPSTVKQPDAETARPFRPHLKPADTVIAIGTGAPELLRALPCKSKLIVEADGDACRRSIYDLGIDALQSWEDIPEGGCDALISRGGLECDAAPLDTLRRGFASLARGGRAVFTVPAPDASAPGKPALYAWNTLTLGNLFAAAGFAVESVSPAAAGALHLVARKP